MSAREDLFNAIGHGGTGLDEGDSYILINAYRAEVLNDAADAVDAAFYGEPFLNYPPELADHLRHMAREQ